MRCIRGPGARGRILSAEVVFALAEIRETAIAGRGAFSKGASLPLSLGPEPSLDVLQDECDKGHSTPGLAQSSAWRELGLIPYGATPLSLEFRSNGTSEFTVEARIDADCDGEPEVGNLSCRRTASSWDCGPVTVRGAYYLTLSDCRAHESDPSLHVCTNVPTLANPLSHTGPGE